MNTYILNGRNINNLDTLYKEFARSVNAPDGYFGKCLQSFDDCLFGGFGLESSCEIIWNDSEFSKQAMDCKALENYCFEVIKNCPFLNEEGFEGGKEWAYTTLSVAKSGDRALFDEVVEMIYSVPERASWEHKIKLQLK